MGTQDKDFCKMIIFRQEFIAMKRIFYLCLVCLINGLVLSAQTTEKSLKFFNKTEAGVSFGIGSFKTDVINNDQKKARNDEIVITLQTINGVKYMDHLGVGLSFGVEKWSNGLLWPLYAYISYDLKPSDNTFYGAVYLGYAFGTRYKTSFFEQGKGAFGLSIGLGYKMKIAKNLAFMYEIFYKYQAIESNYNIWVTDTMNVKKLIRNVDYKVPLHFAGFKIGICFP